MAIFTFLKSFLDLLFTFFFHHLNAFYFYFASIQDVSSFQYESLLKNPSILEPESLSSRLQINYFYIYPFLTAVAHLDMFAVFLEHRFQYNSKGTHDLYSNRVFPKGLWREGDLKIWLFQRASQWKFSSMQWFSFDLWFPLINRMYVVHYSQVQNETRNMSILCSSSSGRKLRRILNRFSPFERKLDSSFRKQWFPLFYKLFSILEVMH